MKPLTGCTGTLLSFFQRWKASKSSKRSEVSNSIYHDDNRLPGLYLLLFYLFLIIALSLSDILCSYAQTSSILSGRVIDEKGDPLAGTIIRIKGQRYATSTGKSGDFSIRQVPPNAVLIVSFIGFKTKEVPVPAARTALLITLSPDAAQLQEVEVVSTGYQQIPKERATGSFVQVDSALLNRRVSTNILDRLDGVTGGLIFNRQAGASDQNLLNFVQIRGRSTLGSYGSPLLVVDNFPYEGDITDINPNDVESVSVLKDAAAASVWGARSGNGVIVITTKKGRVGSRPQITLSSNVSVAGKPDLFAASNPQLSSAQFIEVEQFLFNQGAYNSSVSNGYTGLSPAVEIFLAAKNGSISSADSLSRINALKQYDSRNELLRHYYQRPVNQQYYTSISGGAGKQQYFFSAGYDAARGQVVHSSNERVTFNARNSWSLLNDRLELVSGITYSGSRSSSGPSVSGLLPYDYFTDADGNPLALVNSNVGSLRLAYADTAGAGKLRDWKYRLLDEINNSYGSSRNNQNDYRLRFNLNYRLAKALAASGYYAYQKISSETKRLYDEESFYTRNLINTYTQIGNSGITYGMPLGDILNEGDYGMASHAGRLQLNYNQVWGKHAVNAIGGYEIRTVNNGNSSNTLYGYDPETLTNKNSSITPNYYYPYYYGSGSGTISTVLSEAATDYHFLSAYANASYTYNRRYIASFSIRKDESNLFGVRSNQKGVPLWSSGLSWIINEEPFYNMAWLPRLKLRATFGYTGNVDNSLSAVLTASSRSSNLNLYKALYSGIVNPPNPSLKWERVRNADIGLDFGSRGDRIEGSIDLWQKKGLDLIGEGPVAPQTGISTFTGNSANTRSEGIDLRLNSLNIRGKFTWRSALLYNYAKNKVTQYLTESGSNYSVITANSINPLPGYPENALFSFRYAGLDANGNPKGYVDGKESLDYSAIYNSKNRADLVYSGPAVPLHFGSLRNSFAWKGCDLSFNIVYKFGYYFRRTSLNNSTLYGYNGVVSAVQADYENRWQHPGDELKTKVPALVYPDDFYRSAIYTYSDATIEKGDHVRLQDIRVGYTPARKRWKGLNIYAYLDNIGILWRANSYHIDPDYIGPLSVSVGVKASL